MWLIWVQSKCFQACERHPALFKRVMPMAWQWRTWPLHNNNIHYSMPPFVEMGIDLRFKGLNLEIMFIYNIPNLGVGKLK